MNNIIEFYAKKLYLEHCKFELIEHADAMVALVYKITKPDNKQLILKICPRSNDYHHEVYFLKYFEKTLSVPKVIQTVQPETNIYGAILMECLPGDLLKIENLDKDISYSLGSLLAKIHINKMNGYGDPIQEQNLSKDSRVYFSMKFQEGLDECENNLPKALFAKSQTYFNDHINLLLDLSDGPCIVHRDFRPGNIIINNDQIQGIIDWSSARNSFAQEDFISIENMKWPEDLKNYFYDGYQSIRPLPELDLILPLLRLSKAIATIGFIVKKNTYKTKDKSLYLEHLQILKSLVV